jgi:hypothetical protein
MGRLAVPGWAAYILRSMLRRYGILLAALLLGLVVLPIAIFVVGQRWVEPYEGARGIGTFFGTVYGDAARGRPLALALLFSPFLLALLWRLHRVVRHRLSNAAENG